MQSIPAWLWPAAAWTLLAFAAWLFAAPWWRRYPGRWCHRCGYDMAGIPSVTCPECGRTAKSERALTRKPIHTLRRTAAIILALAAWPVANASRTVERGSVALVPNWLLARIAPTAGTQFDIQNFHARKAPFPFKPSLFGEPPETPAERLRSALYLETWSRLEDDELGDAAGAAYLRRVYATDPERDSELSLPRAWPGDRAFNPPPQTWSPYFNSSGRLRSSHGLVPLEADTEWRASYTPGGKPTLIHRATFGTRTYVLTPPFPTIDLSTPADEFMSPVNSPAIDEKVAALIFPRLYVVRNRAIVHASGMVQSPPTGDVPWYGVFTVSVLVDSQEIGRGSGGWAGSREIPISIDWREGGESRAADSPANVTLEITGDEKNAWQAYALDWTHKREAWAGRLTLKPAISRGDR